ncbi:MAG: SCO family protein [bacterium]|jgi:protein SCO1/2|nr:SCO family protein [Betaproteobacteria bacterium]
MDDRRRYLPSAHRRTLLSGAGGTLALAALGTGCVLLAGCDSRPSPVFHSIDVTGATFGQGFDLTDFNGDRRTLADYKGKVVALFFGFTQCPDACPTALAKLAEVSKGLGADAARLQVVFITVDPERDTAELLRNYVPAFHPAFTGLRGSPEQIAAVAKAYKAYYSKVAGKTPESYTIDHSTFTYLYDPEGRLRLMARHEITVAQLAADVRQLMRG